MNLFERKKIQFVDELLSQAEVKIGFVDVGSGGPLKEPWKYISKKHLEQMSIEPMDKGKDMPMCISNRRGTAKFYVAHDERGSSLHEPLDSFAQRFGQASILTKEIIDVEVTTLDQYFHGKASAIDAMDINTEGHDFQVLEGAQEILSKGNAKLLKVEFELVPVWKNQGWFSDIDQHCRANGYELAKFELESSKPMNVRHVFHPGEPLWGKAYYVPSEARWQEKFTSDDDVKAVVLYVLADIPGRAYDVLEKTDTLAGIPTAVIQKKIKSVFKYKLLEEAKINTLQFFKMPLRILKYCFR